MKKLLALVMITAILVSSLIIKISASVVEYDPFCDDTEVNIVYLGGSITQRDGYRNYISNYFVQKYKKEGRTINNVNVGIGGTPSSVGLMRLEHDVISYEPDVVFIEFSVNDTVHSDEAAYMSIEGIVRKLQSLQNSPYIVFVYTAQGSLVTSKDIHHEIAEYYDIPEIDFHGWLKHLGYTSSGTDYNNYASSGPKNYLPGWKNFFTVSDTTHVNADGALLWAKMLLNDPHENLNISYTKFGENGGGVDVSEDMKDTNFPEGFFVSNPQKYFKKAKVRVKPYYSDNLDHVSFENIYAADAYNNGMLTLKTSSGGNAVIGTDFKICGKSIDILSDGIILTYEDPTSSVNGAFVNLNGGTGYIKINSGNVDKELNAGSVKFDSFIAVDYDFSSVNTDKADEFSVVVQTVNDINPARIQRFFSAKSNIDYMYPIANAIEEAMTLFVGYKEGYAIIEGSSDTSNAIIALVVTKPNKSKLQPDSVVYISDTRCSDDGTYRFSFNMNASEYGTYNASIYHRGKVIDCKSFYYGNVFIGDAIIKDAETGLTIDELGAYAGRHVDITYTLESNISRGDIDFSMITSVWKNNNLDDVKLEKITISEGSESITTRVTLPMVIDESLSIKTFCLNNLTVLMPISPTKVVY